MGKIPSIQIEKIILIPWQTQMPSTLKEVKMITFATQFRIQSLFFIFPKKKTTKKIHDKKAKKNYRSLFYIKRKNSALCFCCCEIKVNRKNEPKEYNMLCKKKRIKRKKINNF